MFKFTSDYKIGIPEIDKEHEYLFQLLNNAICSLDKEQAAIQNVTEDLLNNLKDYALNHFAHEEAYMKKINDPELPRQQREHSAFTRKMNEFTIDDSLKVCDVEELLQYIVRWLFGHILARDMMIGKIKTDPFTFTSKYATNIAFMDEEHKTLFDIIRQANDLIHADYLHDKYDEIMKILSKLKNYTERHFKHEEEYMESIQYPKLEAQKRAHTAFIEKLVNINFHELNDIDDNQQQYLEELIDYLLSWLSDHILKSDCLIPVWEKEQQQNA